MSIGQTIADALRKAYRNADQIKSKMEKTRLRYEELTAVIRVIRGDLLLTFLASGFVAE